MPKFPMTCTVKSIDLHSPRVEGKPTIKPKKFVSFEGRGNPPAVLHIPDATDEQFACFDVGQEYLVSVSGPKVEEKETWTTRITPD